MYFYPHLYHLLVAFINSFSLNERSQEISPTIHLELEGVSFCWPVDIGRSVWLAWGDYHVSGSSPVECSTVLQYVVQCCAVSAAQCCAVFSVVLCSVPCSVVQCVVQCCAVCTAVLCSVCNAVLCSVCSAVLCSVQCSVLCSVCSPVSVVWWGVACSAA